MPQHSLAERRKLKQHHAEALTQHATRRIDDGVDRVLGIEKGLGRTAQELRTRGGTRCGERGMSLHEKAKALGHRRAPALKRGHADGRVETSINADGTQQRMLRVGGEALTGEFAFLVSAVIHEPLPAGEGPCGRTPMHASRQGRSERHLVCEGRYSGDGRAACLAGRSLDERLAE